jgi:hypothetical protein
MVVSYEEATGNGRTIVNLGSTIMEHRRMFVAGLLIKGRRLMER